MISISTKHLQLLIDENIDTINLQFVDLRCKLMAFKNSVNRDIHEKYLDFLIANLREIVFAKPDKLNDYADDFEQIISAKDLKDNHSEFRNELIEILGYKKLRRSFFPNIFKKNGINACAYCNSQLTVIVKKKKTGCAARFQFDHYLSKSKYPCLSISFFNLIPVCGSCNGKKGEKIIGFKLYQPDDILDDSIKSNSSFELEKKSLANYLLHKNSDVLKVKFNDKEDGLEKTFGISSIYNTQLDIAEELISKSLIYTETYKESLKHSFRKIYGNSDALTNRIIIGNYSEDIHIHKRPMSKFTQDIARQLKLIPKNK